MAAAVVGEVEGLVLDLHAAGVVGLYAPRGAPVQLRGVPDYRRRGEGAGFAVFVQRPAGGRDLSSVREKGERGVRHCPYECTSASPQRGSQAR